MFGRRCDGFMLWIWVNTPETGFYGINGIEIMKGPIEMEETEGIWAFLVSFWNANRWSGGGWTEAKWR